MPINEEKPQTNSVNLTYTYTLTPQQIFAIDAISGAGAGAITGATVAPTEGLKVWLQTRKPGDKFSWNLMMRLMRGMPMFGAQFAAVCAIEFSVNARVGENYGPGAGTTASATTGALFLTAADHLLYRSQALKQPFSRVIGSFSGKWPTLFTGFTPMVGREAFFISSVIYFGPSMGAWYQKLQGKGDAETTDANKAAGRMTTGLLTTWLSQPLDTATRQMQVELHKSGKPTSWKDELVKLRSWNGLRSSFRGATPRLVLATCGGTMAGFWYDRFSKSLKGAYSASDSQLNAEQGNENNSSPKI